MAQFPRSQINKITYAINGGAIEVHRRLGPGLFESTYQKCMEWELRDRGLSFSAGQPLPLEYKGLKIEQAYKVDLWVEGLVVVELKCVAELAPVHETQLLTYLKLTGAPIGLLINFNVPILKSGIQRLLNKDHELVEDILWPRSSPTQ